MMVEVNKLKLETDKLMSDACLSLFGAIAEQGNCLLDLSVGVIASNALCLYNK